jgi:hypothetical protein
MSAPETPAGETEAPTETLPTFSEQVADQLGGVRGMIESGLPVVAFVLANILWSLTPAVIVAVAMALAIAGFRLTRKQSVRHAINGLFGIAIGAFVAFRTGRSEDFYVPGILLSLAYGIAMVISVVIRRPLVGWIWSIVVDRGGTRWHMVAGLRRTFGWLTVVWAVTFFVKVVVNVLVYFSDLGSDEKTSVLGIMRITLGFPPYALLVALTVWAVRRHLRAHAPAEILSA